MKVDVFTMKWPSLKAINGKICIYEEKKFGKIDSWGQFYQHFKSSFYAYRSQKRQKDCQVKQIFALSGSAWVKAARKHVGEIDQELQTKGQPTQQDIDRSIEVHSFISSFPDLPKTRGGIRLNWDANEDRFNKHFLACKNVKSTCTQ